MKQTSTQIKRTIKLKIKKATTFNNLHHHSSIIPNLPVELLEEIFNRVSLHIKTITEFQTLTNSYRLSSMFSNPKLAESQTNLYARPCILAYRADHNELFLLEGQNDTFLSTKIDMDFTGVDHAATRNVEILSSCKGLLLLTDRRLMWVVNPLTREPISLPEANEGFFTGDNSWYAIGFSPTHETYKVVRVVGSLRQAEGGYYLEFCWNAEVLTLGANTWRKINGCDLVLQTAIMEDEVPVLIKGALYWLAHIRNRQEIIKFDIDSEEFVLVSSPLDEEGLGFGFSLCSLGAVDDMLCVARYQRRRRSCDGDPRNGLEMWVLRSAGKWELWKKINLVYMQNLRCLKKFETIRASESDEEILMMLQDPLKLVYYDTKKHGIREAQIDAVDCMKMKGVLFCPNFRSITTCIKA